MNSTIKPYPCCICGDKMSGFGNNPFPMCEVDDVKSRCCDTCNSMWVFPVRVAVSKANAQSPEEARAIVKKMMGVSE